LTVQNQKTNIQHRSNASAEKISTFETVLQSGIIILPLYYITYSH